MGKSQTSEGEEEQATTPILGGRVRHALTRIVDFGEPRRLHARAALRFKERRFRDAFQAAKNAVARIEGESRDYVESGMALAIASARRILETSEGSTKGARKVSEQLREVMHAFESGSFDEAVPLLESLETAVSSLYAHEMDRHRTHVAAQGRTIAEIQAMGGDTTLSRRKLRRAVLALAQDDRESYLEVIVEVDELVDRARAKRVEAITAEASSVEGPLREGLARALETGDFIAGHFLLLASRETAFRETPPSSATFQDSRKVALLKEVLAQIEAVIQSAEEEELDVTPAAEDLAAAKRLAEKQDYAQALVRGRRAYHLLKVLRNQGEVWGEEEPEEPGGSEEPIPEDAEEDRKVDTVDEEKDTEFVEGETLLWCLECGSVQVGLDPDGGLRCLRCDAQVPVTFP